jgi:tRNA nucleotidyltransferase (CCA-adding enzyme)
MWFMRLPPEQARAVTDRLHFATSLAEDVLAASRLWHHQTSILGIPPSAIVKHLDSTPLPAVYAVYLAADPGGDETSRNMRDVLQIYLFHWRKIVPTINGDDLRKRGLPPGPLFRDILTTLRNAWLDGKVTTVEQEAELLETLICESGA